MTASLSDDTRSLAEDLDNLAYRLGAEGIDYALLHYSSWNEFEHSAPDLYQAIRTATTALEEMLYLLEAKYGRELG